MCLPWSVLVNTTKTVDTDHNKSFISRILKHSAHEMKTTMLKDDGVCNVWDNIWMYRAERFTMHLCQLAQHAVILMQLEGNMPYLSTTNHSESSRQDIACNQHQLSARGRRHKTSIESYAVAASLETPATGKNITRVDGCDKLARRVLSPTASELRYCRICLGRDHSMKRCPFRSSADKLVATRKTNWNYRSYRNHWRTKQLSWESKRRDGARWDSQESWHQNQEV